MFCNRKRQRNGLENFSLVLEALHPIEEHYDEIVMNLVYFYTTEEKPESFRLKASRGYSDAITCTGFLPASWAIRN